MLERFDIEPFTMHTPPGIGRILGYQGGARWVAFFWGTKVDGYCACNCHDGKTFYPANQLAWDAFFSHPLIVTMNHKRENGRAKKKFEFGHAQLTSEHCLLLDRRQRLLYAAPKATVLEYLGSAAKADLAQHLEPLSSRKAMEERDTIPQAGANGSLQLIDEMVNWLDKQIELLIGAGQWPKLD